MNKKILVFIFVFGFGLIYLFVVYLTYSFVYPVKYQEQIAYCCSKFNVQKAIVFSVINAESSFNESVVSRSGAIGLMQILPSTADYIAYKVGYTGPIDLNNVECNIYLGVAYLSYLFNRFCNFDKVICAYNAGESEVNTWGYDKNGKIIIPFKETKKYLENVKRSLQFYSKKIA